ncbi:MAG: cupin domain-containing protein [Verrucomicrobiae bacterium]|nr:cupin domain-containing protein [Verrucomicrobiae bacterium]
MKETFRTTGYHIERGIFTESECRRLLKSIRSEDRQSIPIWGKSGAVVHSSLAMTARNEKLLDVLSTLIGGDIILWGAYLIQRSPKQVHHWHNDLESFSDQNYVSVWIGLKQTDLDTSLKVIPGSHLIEKPIRQFAHEEQVSSQNIQDDAVLKWSRSNLPDSRIEQLDTRNGDALFFDGRLWHGSSNKSRYKKRWALLLQYTRASTPVRIPNFSYNRWPIDFYAKPKPPCLLVRGSDPGQVNDIFPGPPAVNDTFHFTLSTVIEPVKAASGQLGDKLMESIPVAEGPTPDLQYMEIHYSILNVGRTPHPPHVHIEEEVLMIVNGEAELIVEDAKGSNNLKRHAVKAGDFIYYPANWRHTIENTSDQEVVYLMFKWKNEEPQNGEVLESVLIRGSSSLEHAKDAPNSFETELLLEGRTGYLRKLHSHASHVLPGGGYDAHADAYDVGIVLMEGAFETLGEKVEAPALVYYASGEKHGLRGLEGTTAKYIVFEFHGKHGDVYENPKLRRRRRMKQALTNPGIIVKHLSWKLSRLLKK